jgi:hypothetical protein
LGASTPNGHHGDPPARNAVITDTSIGEDARSL